MAGRRRFVSLAALQAAEQVETTLADAFELVDAEGERPREVLARLLAPRELLLVLDNFEHLLPAAPLISELLGAAPGLTVLATSREPLGLRGEHVVRVAGLSDEDAAELFLERARDHDPDLAPDDTEREAIVALCRRLDGLPLAIELTASWTSRSAAIASSRLSSSIRWRSSIAALAMRPRASARCAPPSTGVTTSSTLTLVPPSRPSRCSMEAAPSMPPNPSPGPTYTRSPSCRPSR